EDLGAMLPALGHLRPGRPARRIAGELRHLLAILGVSQELLGWIHGRLLLVAVGSAMVIARCRGPSTPLAPTSCTPRPSPRDTSLTEISRNGSRTRVFRLRGTQIGPFRGEKAGHWPNLPPADQAIDPDDWPSRFVRSTIDASSERRKCRITAM